MTAVKKAIILLAPLISTPLWGVLIAEGYLSFGAGEKDLLLLIPWCLWAVLFICFGLLLSRAKISFKIWVVKSLIYSMSIMLFLWLGLLLYLEITTG